MSKWNFSPLKLIVFDWAGTVVDFGSRAPVVALVRALKHEGVTIGEEDARAGMGLAKLDHVRNLLARPNVGAGWKEAHGALPGEADALRIYHALEPLMFEAASEASELIPGVADVVTTLHAAGLKLASCTGYTRPMMGAVIARAAEQGFRPDLVTCAGETLEGRPSPLMVYRSCVELGVWPTSAVVKIDDATVGIEEGLSAGAWTIGIAASGNGVGLSREALAALPQAERDARIAHSRGALEAAGAHYIVETTADILPVIAHIAARMRAGARP
jgi:phosphonoacetaldehyde hydrolase